MKCTGCGAVNPDGTNFCKQCGKRLAKAPSPADNTVFCCFCGMRADEDAQFCIGCGKPFFNKENADLRDNPLMTLPIINKYMGDSRTGITQATGRILIFPDRLEFHRRIGSSVGASFGDAQKGRGDRAGAAEVFPIAEIASCVYSPYTLQMPAMVLTMKNGQAFKFGKADKEKELHKAIALINEKIQPSAPKKNSARRAQPDRERDMFSFVMPISNFVAIEDYGTAIIGEVQTGSVAAGDTIYILGEDNASKGSFEVRSVAVNKKIAPRAFAGNDDVALLLFCPPTFIKSGDKACF